MDFNVIVLSVGCLLLGLCTGATLAAALISVSLLSAQEGRRKK